MKRISILITTLLITLTLAACGTMGKNFDHTRAPQIQNNVTTQTQILDWFGTPFKEGTENRYIMWTYQFDKWYAFSETKSKDLVILFDEKHIVRAHRYTSNMTE